MLQKPTGVSVLSTCIVTLQCWNITKGFCRWALIVANAMPLAGLRRAALVLHSALRLRGLPVTSCARDDVA